METRRRHAQTPRVISETARTRLQKSSNKSQETFLPAWQRATVASTSAYVRCPTCPMDGQRLPHRVLRRRSRQAEALHYRGSEYLRAQNSDSRQRAFRFARREARVAGR